MSSHFGNAAGGSPRDLPRLHRLQACALAVALLAGAWPGHAQSADPNLVHPTEVVTVERQGYTIAGLATHLARAKTFKYGIALFPGHPGIMRLRHEDGRLKFDLAGNFVVRSRRQWLDDETLVVVVDAPSDEWAAFSQDFRATPRYGADVAALLEEAGRRYGVNDWTFVGTSEGSVSAYYAARMNPRLARRTILTSSLFQPSRNGPGLSGAEWDDFPGSLLWVHHEDDPCPYTSYRDAKAFAQRSRAPLVTVRGGGPGRGGECQPFRAHGFVGVEVPTVRAMRSWVKTGAVPADVRP
jgi:pimeloyl-ACP methyl ester carboxylesterase